MTTPNPQSARPPIYPISYHALSPTFSRWVPLRASDIHSLRNLGMFDNGMPQSPFLLIPSHLSILQPDSFIVRVLTASGIRAVLMRGCTGKPIYHLLNHPIKWVRITGVVVAVDEFGERMILTVDDSSGSCIECVCAVPALKTSQTANAAAGHLDQFQVQISSKKDEKAGAKAAAGQADKGKAVQKEQGRDAEKGQDAKGQPSAQNPLIPWESVDIGSVLKIKGQITSFRDMKQVDVIKIDIIAGTEAEVKCWEEVFAFRQTVLSNPWIVTREEGERCLEKALRKRREGQKAAPGRSEGRKTVSDRAGRDEGSGSKARRAEAETEEERRRRHEMKKRKKEREVEGLDPANKINYPSMAVRRKVAGKYDALGI
jgi:hypothetical protein